MQRASQIEATDEGRRRGGGGRRGEDEDGFSKRGTKRGASDSNLTDNERFDLERFEKRLRLLSLRAYYNISVNDFSAHTCAQAVRITMATTTATSTHPFPIMPAQRLHLPTEPAHNPPMAKCI